MAKKKIALIAGIVALCILCCGGAGMFSFTTPSDDAKLLGNTPQECEQGCDEPCFCNQSCILWYCWGNYYCQCSSG
jgi:hypothetical protein